MDAFGSNATAKGGIFGRIDSIYGAIECQKSGTLHVHIQAFVQCYHQFTPLIDLLKLGDARLVEMLQRYSSYSAHVR
ncbi:MAG: helitron helicase-like domain-containing protein, partial [Cohaesibacter sp.]|nr:helitron helicase-like domain-containing protein [Cohaesibacter sp.]